MSPDDVPAELVEKAVDIFADEYLPGEDAPRAMRHALAAVLPLAQAAALEELHENYEFLYNTRGEPVAAVPSSDFDAALARLREGSPS